MEFTATRIKGVFLIGLNRVDDHRGFFARAWCKDEFARHGLTATMVQLNVGFSYKRGTLRGLHYQETPHEEAKLVRCTRGGIFDVVVDLRTDSPTRGQWIGAELTAGNALMLYAPEGCAHGYQTLTDDAEMYYLASGFYVASAAVGVRYNDPAFAIDWPLPVSAISEADEKWPTYPTQLVSRLAPGGSNS